MTKDLPSPDILRKLLRYDASTGKLYWRVRPPDLFDTEARANQWNLRYAGKEAFARTGPQGYKGGVIFKQKHPAHRVIWAMEFGYWPTKDIDHIDMIKDNNTLSNLRLATRQQNCANTKAKITSASGVKGVYRHSDNVRWRAQIKADGIQRHLGLFHDIGEAKAAYDNAAKRAHGEFWRAS